MSPLCALTQEPELLHLEQKESSELVLHPEMLKGFTSSCPAAAKVSWGGNSVGEAPVQHQMVSPGLETQLGSQGSFFLRICP